MSIDSLNSANLNVNQPEAPVKDPVNVQFRANDNNKLQRTPQQDEFVKKNNVGVKVGIGAVLATIVAGTADAVFNDGKNLKKIFKNFGKKPKGPVKDIDLGVKTPEERKVLDEAIDRLKGKTSETANSAGTKTAGEAVGGSHKRTYSGSSSSSGSAQSSRSKRGNKRVNAEPKVVSEVKTEVKPSGREVIKGEVNNYHNVIEDAKLVNNADQAHLSAKERKIVEQGLEDVSTEVKPLKETLSEADKQVLQNHQEKVAEEYADAHRIINNSIEAEPKVATVSKEAIDKLGDEIKGIDGSIKKLEQQIAGAKKFGKNTENLEKQLSNLQQKRATKVAELEGMKKPVAEPKVEGKKGKKKVEKAKTEVGSEKFVPKKINTIYEANKFVEDLEREYKHKISELGIDGKAFNEAMEALSQKYDENVLREYTVKQFDKTVKEFMTEYSRIAKPDEVLPILQDYQARLVAMSQRNAALSPEIAEIFSNKSFEMDELIEVFTPKEIEKMFRAEYKPRVVERMEDYVSRLKHGVGLDKELKEKHISSLKQGLDGKLKVNVGTKKSKELQELADHYHAEELRSAAKDKGLRPDPLARAQAVLSDGALDNMEWVSRNLTEDESLRRALDIPRKFKVEYSDAIKQPYVKTNKGRYIVLDRETQLWHEFDKSTWEQISSRRKSWYENAISLTRSNEEGEVLRKIRPRNGGKAKFVLQVPEKQGRIVYDKNGATKYQGREKEVLNETLHETELNAVLFGTPEHRAYTKHTPDGKVSGTIQQYVSTYPEGTFQKSSKRITLFENGSPKTVKLAYEGEDFDIDVYGRILKKQKVRDHVRESAIARAEREYSYSRPSSYASNSSRNRRKVNA